MADGVLTAPAMARAAALDAQFAVPARPRVRRGITVHRVGPALVIDGTPTRHRLRGRAATDLVPVLLPLLDGTRDLPAIAAAAGRDGGDVFAALSLLWTCGVTEEAPPPGFAAGGVPDHLADHLSRVGDATQANPSWEQAAQRLRAARVELFGVGPLRDALPAAFGRSLATSPATGGRPAPGTTLAIAVDTMDPALVASCWADGVPLLRIRLRGQELDVGPYVDPALGPCLSCQLDGEPDGAGSQPGPGAVALAAGLAAGDVVGLISRAYPVALPLRWHRVDLDRLVRSQRCGATRPGCPSCSVRVTGVPPRPPTVATRYEAAVALPPRAFADLKAHQAHYQPANVALQRGHRTWPTAPRCPLPAPDLDSLAGGPAGTVDTGTVDTGTVGLLLAVAAGWRSQSAERVRRWTASGGNIGSVVAHLVARDVTGLPPGVYGYVAPDHELALLRGRPPDPGGSGAPAELVLTADLPRVASKYGAFGLRVTLLDAGCAQAALLATAAALGLVCRCVPVWDDRMLAELVGVDPDAEPVTAVLTLGGPS